MPKKTIHCYEDSEIKISVERYDYGENLGYPWVASVWSKTDTPFEVDKKILTETQNEEYAYLKVFEELSTHAYKLKNENDSLVIRNSMLMIQNNSTYGIKPDEKLKALIQYQMNPVDKNGNEIPLEEIGKTKFDLQKKGP